MQLAVRLQLNSFFTKHSGSGIDRLSSYREALESLQLEQVQGAFIAHFGVEPDFDTDATTLINTIIRHATGIREQGLLNEISQTSCSSDLAK